MYSINRTELNQRFITIYSELEKRGEVVKNSREKSKSAFAGQLKTKGHIIDKWLRGERKITYDQAKALCQNYGVSELYMFQGKGKPFPNKKQLPAPEPVSEVGRQKLADVLNIPFSPNILFTNVEAFSSNTVGVDLLEENQRFHIPGIFGDLVAFNINGNSMSPTISNGDMVICMPLEDNKDIKDNEVYAVVANNSVWVKRVQKCCDRYGRFTHLKLISDNYEEFDPFLIEIKEVRKLLKVKRRLTGLNEEF
jgi:phage repressor protein C with HTH and peptisase S24 domain